MATATRDRILDALEEILVRDGTDKATLDAVAAGAGVSKGGLLYHFPSKDAMMAAMVRRLAERAERKRLQAADAGASLAEWYLSPPATPSTSRRGADVNSEPDSGPASEPDLDPDDALEIALFRSTLAAFRSTDGAPGAVQDAVVEMMGMYDRVLQDEFDDPVHAEIVRLVGDGLYLAALVGLPGPDPDLHRRVVERLLGDQVR
ncbi:TetR/AcrR family transcriptional regulator [Rhodococcoides corynebacterioides]|uniref:TetR/AcrR family transcriptional regulator n=1 Tax=Rhodococcoides corynebacterioides TaxID=53972 RepID=A0ABS7P350_9NOCA|nr:TetR/AcrR family transcriptional regulator [Rhodococcus corynebacterioides]MBY6366740.1 TetR/AcrR family transcriptional regulator [Rhodococcus corynebacterioides]MBY6409309.1 TetR/AcrR family transcriptional regulator [Rhodococcus corynebacterioides]